MAQLNTCYALFQIFGTREDQFGRYRCEAANRYGSSYQEMELYQSEIPICPPVCGDIQLQNKSCGLSPIKALVLFLACIAAKIVG